MIFIGLAAVLLGMSSFAGILDLDAAAVSSLILIVLGAGLSTFALPAKAAAREESQPLPEAEVKTLHMKHLFPGELARRAAEAQSFILDTNLNAEIPRLAGTSPQDEYRKILSERVRAGEVAFRQVVCIFQREHFERVLEQIVSFRETDYYIRHYEPPPKAIPIVHLMSFDDEHFYLGGFYSAEASTQETVVSIRHPAVRDLLREYWNVLWNQAKPLNAGRVIDWEELKEIAKRLRISEQEFTELRTAAANKSRLGG